MNKFGVVKSKLLTKLTESYAKENKSEVKELITTISGNKNFKELYLFYEEIENKYIEDRDTAKLYVETVESILNKTNTKQFNKFCDMLGSKLEKIKSEKNELYESLDFLSEKTTLQNIENKMNSKKFLYEYLTRKKETKQINKEIYTENENLLHAVLTNNFNILYGNTLNEDDKKNLKEILSLSQDELTLKSTELKESLFTKIEMLLNESTDEDLKLKLNKVKEEIQTKKISRINYYRLIELKNGLN